jgi:hypothetical protein
MASLEGGDEDAKGEVSSGEEEQTGEQGASARVLGRESSEPEGTKAPQYTKGQVEEATHKELQTLAGRHGIKAAGPGATSQGLRACPARRLGGPPWRLDGAAPPEPQPPSAAAAAGPQLKPCHGCGCAAAAAAAVAVEAAEGEAERRRRRRLRLRLRCWRGRCGCCCG